MKATARTAKKHWLVKQEPETYSWEKFVADGSTAWTGVRSFPARLNLQAMQIGDSVFYYHSVTGKAVVGLAEVTRAAYPDPTATEPAGPAVGAWLCVDLRPVRALRQPVPLDVMRKDRALEKMALLRQSRLSVVPLTPAEFAHVLKLGDSVSSVKSSSRAKRRA